MRRSARSNVVPWLTSSGFGVRPFAPVNPTAFLFCAVRLAMRFARLSDRIGAQKRVLFTRQSLYRRRELFETSLEAPIGFADHGNSSSLPARIFSPPSSR